MRWFKHMSNMRNDLFVKKLVSAYSLEGKAVWDLVLELYAEACNETNCGDWIEFDWFVFRKEIGISDKKMEQFLNFFAENSKLSFQIPEKKREKSLFIKIPKMLKFRDEWTQRHQKKLGSQSGFNPVTEYRDQNTDNPLPPERGKSPFDIFFNEYPMHRRGSKSSALREWHKIFEPDGLTGTMESAGQTMESLFSQVMESLQGWKQSDEWKENDGKFVPNAAKFLRDSRWKVSPQGKKQTGKSTVDRLLSRGAIRNRFDPGDVIPVAAITRDQYNQLWHNGRPLPVSEYEPLTEDV